MLQQNSCQHYFCYLKFLKSLENNVHTCVIICTHLYKNLGKKYGVEIDDVIIRIQRIPEIQDLNSRISGIVIVFNTGRVKNKGCHFGGNDNF